MDKATRKEKILNYKEIKVKIAKLRVQLMKKQKEATDIYKKIEELNKLLEKTK
jgi:uncharacterized protein YaaR (DUF327 family)